MAVPDRGLDVLLAEINSIAPGRSKTSDGWIGDQDHQSRDSDHNPETIPGNPPDQVDARDFTHDPAHGADMAVISEKLRKSRDRRISYVIFNRRIFSSYAANGYPAWTWRPYSGDNPHDKHMHVSVVDNPHDVTAPWGIGAQDMTPGQAYKQHVINYRTEAIVANREIVVVPKFEVRDETDKLFTFPGFTETNQLAVAVNALLNRPQAVVDVPALAVALDELIDQGATEEQIRALLNNAQY